MKNLGDHRRIVRHRAGKGFNLGLLSRDAQEGLQIAREVRQRGKPMSLDDGYATLRTAYDPRGKMTLAQYYGVHGEPVLSKKNGYHGWEAEYDEQGHQTVIAYLGLDGKPALLPDGYATMKSTYDERGKPIRVVFYKIGRAHV